MSATIEQQQLAKAPGDEVLDLRQAAILLDKSYSCVFGWVHSNKGMPTFEAVKGGKRKVYRIRKSELLAWAEKNPQLFNSGYARRGRGKSDPATSHSAVVVSRPTTSAATWMGLNNKTLKIKVMQEDGRSYVLGFEQNGKMHVLVEGK